MIIILIIIFIPLIPSLLVSILVPFVNLETSVGIKKTIIKKFSIIISILLTLLLITYKNTLLEISKLPIYQDILSLIGEHKDSVKKILLLLLNIAVNFLMKSLDLLSIKISPISIQATKELNYSKQVGKMKFFLDFETAVKICKPFFRWLLKNVKLKIKSNSVSVLEITIENKTEFPTMIEINNSEYEVEILELLFNRKRLIISSNYLGSIGTEEEIKIDLEIHFIKKIILFIFLDLEIKEIKIKCLN